MLFGTRLCLQSLVCYTLVPADAEKGLRAKAQALPFGGLVHHTPCGQYLEGKKQVLSDKQKQRLLSGTTIHEVHRLLGTAFRYAVEWGILIKSPVPVDSPKKSTQERSIWDVGEMQAALASMEDPILHLAVHLTLVGALREGEVAGLTPEDINFDAADGMGTFTINKSMQRVQKASLARTGKDCILREFEDKREGSNTVLVLKKTKTASSCRTIFMTEALKEELKHWFKHLEMDEADMDGRYRNSGMLLRLPNGLAVEPVLIRKKFEKWQDAHPVFPHIVFHGLRHSSATYQLMISGGDIKAVQGTTGHASRIPARSWVKSSRKASTSREQHLCRLPRLKQNRPSLCRLCWSF